MKIDYVKNVEMKAKFYFNIIDDCGERTTIGYCFCNPMKAYCLFDKDSLRLRTSCEIMPMSSDNDTSLRVLNKIDDWRERNEN